MAKKPSVGEILGVRMTNEEFVAAKAELCPFCRGDDTRDVVVNRGEAGHIEVKCSCQNPACGRFWTETFTVVKYEPREWEQDDA